MHSCCFCDKYDKFRKVGVILFFYKVQRVFYCTVFTAISFFMFWYLWHGALVCVKPQRKILLQFLNCTMANRISKKEFHFVNCIRFQMPESIFWCHLTEATKLIKLCCLKKREMATISENRYRLIRNFNWNMYTHTSQESCITSKIYLEMLFFLISL